MFEDEIINTLEASREYLKNWKDNSSDDEDDKKEKVEVKRDKWMPLGFEKKYALTPDGFIMKLF